MTNKGQVTRTAASGSFFRHAWASLALIVLGAAVIGFGFYFQSRPDWTLRPDIRDFNQGVHDYHLPIGVGEAPPLFSTEGLPSVYAVERVGPYFDKAAAEADPNDRKFKSLAYYNLGTLIGRESWALRTSGTARVDLAEGIKKLGEALRMDPTNEDAKYNLELMERAATKEGKQQGAPGPGYSPGVVEKGY
jgi:hypothetical protein